MLEIRKKKTCKWGTRTKSLRMFELLVVVKLAYLLLGPKSGFIGCVV